MDGHMGIDSELLVNDYPTFLVYWKTQRKENIMGEQATRT